MDNVTVATGAVLQVELFSTTMAITNKVPSAGLHHLRWKQCQRECEKLHYWTWARGFKVFSLFFGPDFYLGWCMAQTLIDMSPDWFEVQVLINFFTQVQGSHESQTLLARDKMMEV